MKKQLAKRSSAVSIILGLIFLLGFCSEAGKIQKDMPERDKEFLSNVRYIITKKERKAFRNIPPERRAEFIREFWDRRNPDPGSGENLYKDTYFMRMEEANKLFSSEGKQGWLSDRGRTYIMLGPPERKEVYPQGISMYGPAVEIWYYGFFPIVFIDPHRNGQYRIDYRQSNAYIREINRAEMALNPRPEGGSVSFDVKVSAVALGGGKVELRVEIPYKKMSFIKKRKEYVAEIDLTIEVENAKNEKIKTVSKPYTITLSDKDLDKIDSSHLIKGVVQLKTGDYTMKVSILDRHGEKKVYKSVKVKNRE